MQSALMYPALVSGDWHIHGRGNRGRLAEAEALCSRIEDTQQVESEAGKPLKSLVIAGDLLDRGSVIPVPIILRLAQVFRLFEQVWIIVGNHDCPLRSTTVTQLDIFKLCGAEIVKEPLVAGSALFLPYYTAMPESVPASVRNVFAHKDVREYNSYADDEWAVSVVDFPPEATVFNGHLHAANVTRHSPLGQYVQLGSPYPCTWSDAYQKNQWMWIVQEDSYAATAPLMITGDAEQADSPLYMFLRSRSAKEDDEAIVDEKAIVAALAAVDDGRLSIEQALAAGNVSGRVGKIIKSVVNHVAGRVEGVKL